MSIILALGRWLNRARRVVIQLLGLVSLLGLLSLVAAQADSPNRVGLVVAHGDKVITRCIEFSETEISGYEVLRRANLDLNVDASNSMGAAVCRIDGQGCTYPQEDCFCQCQGTPCRFWIYWHLVNGDWQFSSLGASNYKVRSGSVEGWVWGEGVPSSGGVRPPRLAFEEICAEPPTATLTPTPGPTDTPTSTPTPKPTNTPVPQEKPVIHSFSASQTSITAGQPVQLSWELSGAEAAYLRYNGQAEGIISPGSKTVSPTASTVYTLAAKNDAGETTAEVTIIVNDAPVAPTAAPQPAVAAAAPAASPSPNLVPEPDLTFTAASLTLPPGACTNVQWSARQVETLFLDDDPVELQGSRQVCPGQTQTFRLRAVYPGGEKLAELTLTVIDPQFAPTNTPAPAASSADAETLTTLPAATPAAIVVTPAAEAGTPAGPRRFTVPTASDEKDANSLWWVGGVAAAVVLFVIVPVGLIMTGWIVWWAKSDRHF